MNNKELIIESRDKLSQEEVNKFLKPNNYFDDFDLPIISSDRLETERMNLLTILGGGVIGANFLEQIANSNVLIAEIPPGLNEMFRQGKLHFDNSSQVAGNFTPNLRDGNGNLVGQATIKSNPAAVTSALANLMLYAAIQQIASELAEIHEEVRAIAKIQKSDHYAEITSAYYAYEYTFTDVDKINHSGQIKLQIETGLHKIHASFEPLYSKLRKEPHSFWGWFWNGFNLLKAIDPAHHKAKKVENECKDFVTELFLYYQFILLADIVFNDMGSPNCLENHKAFVKMCQRYGEDEKFAKVMKYHLDHVGNTANEIAPKLVEIDNKLSGELLNNDIDLVKIKISEKDIKTLKSNRYE